MNQTTVSSSKTKYESSGIVDAGESTTFAVQSESSVSENSVFEGSTLSIYQGASSYIGSVITDISQGFTYLSNIGDATFIKRIDMGTS